MTDATRWSIVLALVASMLVVIVPAAAQDGGERTARSPLEEPDPVVDVRLSLTASDMLDAVTALGVDIGHGLRRVPTGIEVDATVPAELMPELEALGVEAVPPGNGWHWDFTRPRSRPHRTCSAGRSARRSARSASSSRTRAR